MIALIISACNRFNNIPGGFNSIFRILNVIIGHVSFGFYYNMRQNFAVLFII
jgi:hypothetical protein